MAAEKFDPCDTCDCVDFQDDPMFLGDLSWSRSCRCGHSNWVHVGRPRPIAKTVEYR